MEVLKCEWVCIGFFGSCSISRREYIFIGCYFWVFLNLGRWG